MMQRILKIAEQRLARERRASTTWIAQLPAQRLASSRLSRRSPARLETRQPGARHRRGLPDCRLSSRRLTLLRISSTLVDCWTGRSDSFSPLRIRPDLATARTMVLACAASTPDQALRQRLEERIAACRRRDRALRAYASLLAVRSSRRTGIGTPGRCQSAAQKQTGSCCRCGSSVHFAPSGPPAAGPQPVHPLRQNSHSGGLRRKRRRRESGRYDQPRSAVPQRLSRIGVNGIATSV